MQYLRGVVIFKVSNNNGPGKRQDVVKFEF